MEANARHVTEAGKVYTVGEYGALQATPTALQVFLTRLTNITDSNGNPLVAGDVRVTWREFWKQTVLGMVVLFRPW